MFQALYIEEEILSHPRVLTLRKQFAHLPHIICARYGEVFNRKGQNFRLQKEGFSLILAKKHGHFLLETPSGYGIGGSSNYYFSHMLNCPFDCRYCFLQGMYRSAHVVLFVNFEDFKEAIQNMDHKESYFFSGYDCDSLALEKISGFASYFLPQFAHFKNLFLELRSKSVNIEPLLSSPVNPRVISAFSLSPDVIAKRYEHRAPSLKARLEAMIKLKERGWPLGLRFDPLIYCENFKEIYGQFFEMVFYHLPAQSIHSATFGPFRLPPNFYKNITNLYPEERLFSLGKREGLMCYQPKIEEELLSFCKEQVLRYLPKELVFPCIERISSSPEPVEALAEP